MGIVVGCGSDDGSTDTTTTTPTVMTAVEQGSTSAGTSAGAPGPTTDAGESAGVDPNDEEAITAVFATFFGGQDSTVDEKVALLQDGERYRSMLDAASANEQFQQMSTNVRDMRPGSDEECAARGVEPGCVIVAHDVLVAGVPMAANVESPATEGADGWLVGAAGWCGIVEIGGASCPDRSAGTSVP